MSQTYSRYDCYRFFLHGECYRSQTHPRLAGLPQITPQWIVTGPRLLQVATLWKQVLQVSDSCKFILLHIVPPWRVRALRNAELCVLVRTFFPWDAWFSLGESPAYTCFFSRHALKFQIKSPLILSIATRFSREKRLLSCLCWPIVWLGLQCSNSDRWLTGLPMRDSVIITRWLLKLLSKDYRIIVWNRCATDLPLIKGRKTIVNNSTD